MRYNKRKMNRNKATGFSDPLDGRGEREEGKHTSKLRSRGQKKEGTQRTWTGPRAVIKALMTRTDCIKSQEENQF